MTKKTNEDNYNVSIQYIKVDYLKLGYFVITMTIIAKIVFDFPLF